MAIILSTPVCGVEVKKEVTAPRVAPFLPSSIAVGTTPQEQSGSGTPIKEDFITEPIPFLPTCFVIHSLFTNT